MASTINVLLMGQTGAGKSTLINYLANFFLKGTLEQLRVAIPTRHLRQTENFTACENAVKDNTQSKTIRCQKYPFNMSGKCYLFIDSPGLSDTNGIVHDDAHLENIFESLQQLAYLTAIILIVNGAQPRATVNIKNVITRFQERMPVSVLKNVIVILTNCQAYTVNFDPHLFDLPTDCPVFHMQNSAFSTHPSSWDSKALDELEKNWSAAMNVIGNILNRLDSLKPISTQTFALVQDERNKIKSLLHSVRIFVAQLQQFENEIDILQEYSQNLREDSTRFKEHECNTIVSVKKIIEASHYNTICSKCDQVCHQNCRLDETTKTGHKSLKNCLVMSKGKCIQCIGSCSYEIHYHDRKDILVKQENVKFILDDMKQRYNQNNANKRKYDSSRERYKEATAYIEECMNKSYLEIEESCRKLKDMCVDFNVVEELTLMMSYLEMDAKLLKSKFVQNKAKAFNQRLSCLCKQLETKPSSSESRTLTELPTNSSSSTIASDSKDDDEIAQLLAKTSERSEERRTSTLARQSSQMNDNSEYPAYEIFSSSLMRQTPMEFADSNAQVAQSILSASKNKSNICHNSPPQNGALPSDWKTWSLEKLVVVYKNESEINKDDRSAIRKELSKRSRGKSIGYLNEENLYQLCKQVVKYQEKSIEEVNELEEKIKDEIEETIDDEITNMLNVKTETLQELFAIKISLKMRKDKS